MVPSGEPGAAASTIPQCEQCAFTFCFLSEFQPTDKAHADAAAWYWDCDSCGHRNTGHAVQAAAAQGQHGTCASLQPIQDLVVETPPKYEDIAGAGVGAETKSVSATSLSASDSSESGSSLTCSASSSAHDKGDGAMAIYLIDCSGSMNVTVEMPELQTVWNAEKERRTGRSAVQGRSRYVSRLDCAKEAAKAQLDRLHALAPQKRVVVILFHQSVSMLSYKRDAAGTGSFTETNVFDTATAAGHAATVTSDMEALLEVGRSIELDSIPPVREAKAELDHCVENLVVRSKIRLSRR